MSALNWKPFVYGGLASIVAEFGEAQGPGGTGAGRDRCIYRRALRPLSPQARSPWTSPRRGCRCRGRAPTRGSARCGTGACSTRSSASAARKADAPSTRGEHRRRACRAGAHRHRVPVPPRPIHPYQDTHPSAAGPPPGLAPPFPHRASPVPAPGISPLVSVACAGLPLRPQHRPVCHVRPLQPGILLRPPQAIPLPTPGPVPHPGISPAFPGSPAPSLVLPLRPSRPCFSPGTVSPARVLSSTLSTPCPAPRPSQPRAALLGPPEIPPCLGQSVPVFPGPGARPGLRRCHPPALGVRGAIPGYPGQSCISRSRSRVMPGPGRLRAGAECPGIARGDAQGSFPLRIAPALLRQASYGTIKIGIYQSLKRLFVDRMEGRCWGRAAQAPSSSPTSHSGLCFAHPFLFPSHPKIPTGMGLHYWALQFCLPVRARIGVNHDGTLPVLCTACGPCPNTFLQPGSFLSWNHRRITE